MRAFLGLARFFKSPQKSLRNRLLDQRRVRINITALKIYSTSLKVLTKF